MAATLLSHVSQNMAPKFFRRPIPARVLVLSADARRARRWRALLLIRRFTVTMGHPDRLGGSLAASGSFDVIVLDLSGSRDAGLSLCRRLRAANLTAPVLTVYPEGGQDDLLAAFDAGTDAYMCGSIEDAELLCQIGMLYRRHAVTARQSQPAEAPETPTSVLRTAAPA